MIRSGERLDLSSVPVPDGRQALHGRGRRQDLPAAVPAGGRMRGGGAPAVGPRARAHRRHARQAGGHPGVPLGSLGGRVRAPAGRDRRRDLRRGLRPGARRPQALRPARRHRHRRVDPPDRQLDHVEEDRRGDRRAGARREGGGRGLHARARPGPGAGAHDGRPRRGARRPHHRPAHRHGHPARARRRQRPGGGRVARGAAGRRSRGRGGGHARPGPRDARPRGHRRGPGPARSPTDGPWTAGGRWSAPRAATRTRRFRSRPTSRRSGRARPGPWPPSTRWRSASPPCASGAGRARKEDPVSPSAGIVLRVSPGDTVAIGQVVAELHADDEAHMEAGRAAFEAAIRMGETPPSSADRASSRGSGLTDGRQGAPGLRCRRGRPAVRSEPV